MTLRAKRRQPLCPCAGARGGRGRGGGVRERTAGLLKTAAPGAAVSAAALLFGPLAARPPAFPLTGGAEKGKIMFMENVYLKRGEHASHAYISASPSESERGRTARGLATALLCEDSGDRPCGRCRACRKSLSGIHPDIISIAPAQDPEGRKKRGITVDQVRSVVADAQVMPNEAAKKVYIFDDADTMNSSAQNAMLKLLEEPPESAAFILCAANPELLLPTVRSRCALIRINADSEEDESARAAARGMLDALNANERRALLEWSASAGNMDARAASAMFRAVREALADELAGRGALGIPPRRCLELDRLFSRCTAYLQVNTGVKHVLGLVAVSGDLPEKK